jgi:hypothetical protein
MQDTGSQLFSKHVGGRHGSRTLFFALAGVGAAVAAWHTEWNRNLWYLVYLCCTYLAVQLLTRKAYAQATAFFLFLFFLVYSPDPPPDLPEVQETFSFQTAASIPPGATRRYRFKTEALRSRQSECGPLQNGDIYVQGLNLAPVLQAEPGVISDQVFEKFYPPLMLLHARIELPAELPSTIRVSLANPKDEPIAVFRGPELSKGRLYPDAVYLIFSTRSCVLVLHAQPVQP